MAYEKQYSDAVRASVETVYGAGFLSPGGAAEVGHILDGLAIEGRDVLDLGCGPGGAAVALAGDLGAGVFSVSMSMPARSSARRKRWRPPGWPTGLP